MSALATIRQGRANLMQQGRTPREVRVNSQFLRELASECDEALYGNFVPADLRHVIRGAVRGELYVYGIKVVADFTADEPMWETTNRQE